MQNLQIYYAETSPHIEYLDQFNLLDETEVDRHFVQTNCYEQTETFSFIQKDYRQQQQIVSYDQWINKLLPIQTLYSSDRLKTIVIGFTLFAFADILQYAYQLSNKTQLDAKKCLKRCRWRILLRILLIFISFVYYPFVVLVLAFIVCNKIIPNQIQTAIDRSQRLKRQLTSAVNNIKFMFIEQFRSIPNLKKELFISLNNLLNFISHNFKIERTFNQYGVDELDEIVFKINNRRKLNNFAERFLAESSEIKRIVLYWKSNSQDQQIEQLITHLHTTHILYEMRKEDELNYPRQKTTLNQNLYYHILIGQLAKLGKDEQTAAKKNLMTVLKRQIELKQIFRARCRQQPVDYQIAKQQEEITQFQERQIDIKRYMCYKDETVQEYVPSSTEAIKEELEKMLKRQQQGEQEESSSEQNQIKSISSEESTYKQEIFSFGFAIKPPARDMSAYYLD